MMHEVKQIMTAWLLAKQQNKKVVLASVVHLKGSSYRRPGVRMLITEDGKFTGAVSGGCVEKEVYRRSLEVFESGNPLVMVYDGRYRLGCEGELFILIEPFVPSHAFVSEFHDLVQKRRPLHLISYFSTANELDSSQGSYLVKGDCLLSAKSSIDTKSVTAGQDYFEQIIPPAFRLIVVGAEHDAVELVRFAAGLGWEVLVVASPRDPRVPADFPDAVDVINSEPGSLDLLPDDQTAIVFMTHSYVRDLQYIGRIINTNPAYIGLLGPAKRREKLLNELIELHPEVEAEFLDRLHGPAGLHIGAETPQEIAISILSEILSVTRSANPVSLKMVEGKIHKPI